MTSTMHPGLARDVGDRGDAVTSASSSVTPCGGGETALGRPVEAALALLERALDLLDVDRITGADAVTLYTLWVQVDRRSLSAKTSLAPRIDASGVWRDTGHGSAAALLAGLEGVTTGAARTTLDVGRRLQHLPDTEDAVRHGTLSGPQAAELSGAAVLDPGTEGELLAGAADEPLQKTRERCARARAAAAQADPLAALRRTRAGRSFHWWTDADGAFRYEGRDTAERGARIIAQIRHTTARLQRTAKTQVDPPEGEARTTQANHQADAAYALLTADVSLVDARHRGDADTTTDTGTATGSDASSDIDEGPPEGQIAVQPGIADDAGPRGVPPSPSDVIDRPPGCSLTVLVDLDALLRGTTIPGETCEIVNQGPIPVAMARDLADDSFLRLAFHRAGDIRAISHRGRTINRLLRTALALRDHSRCVVPGCTTTYGLEIDHVIGWARGGPTELDNPTNP